MEEFKELLKDVAKHGYDYHKDLILGLVLGLLLAWGYHRLIGNRNLRMSYERLLVSKDETIASLKEIIGGKLSDVQVESRGRSFFNKVRKWFRRAK